MIDGIDVVFLHARRPDETASWYRHVLGFRVEFQTSDTSWLEFSLTHAHSTRFAIERIPEEASVVEQQSIMISFKVKNLESVVTVLEEKGVRFYGTPKICKEGSSLFATLKDPEGNWIQLSQRSE